MNAEQRARYKQVGKAAFIREEMTRLGFWPPSPEVAEKALATEAQLRHLYDELAHVQTDLAAVEAQIAEAGDVPKLLAEVRRKRIERVRMERTALKQQRAQEQNARRTQDAQWRQTTLPFLGRGVSTGLVYEGGDASKVAALGLPALETASDVAGAIGITERELAWLTYHRYASAVDHYARFAIPKRRGGTRVISSPKGRLRRAQTWLLNAILVPLPVHDAAMAFRSGLSIVDNAQHHTGRAVIVRVDLKDFFPSVTLPRVRRLFRTFGYNGGVATLLALLATEAPRVQATLDGQRRFVALGERRLPQGACTSPALTNLLCRRLDARLTGAAQSLGFTYTRYADDLIFSHAGTDAPAGMLLTLARQILADEQFTVNEDKTAVLRPHQRQAVTGIVVNQTPHVSRADRRKFRAFLHGCETHGMAEMTRRIGQNARAYACGYLAFLHMVCPEHAAQCARDHAWLNWAPGSADPDP